MCVCVCRRMALQKVIRCWIHAAATTVLGASLRSWVPIDFGEGWRNECEFQVGKRLALVFHLRKNSVPRRQSPPTWRGTAGSRPWRHAGPFPDACLGSPLSYWHDRKQQRQRLRGWEGNHGEPLGQTREQPQCGWHRGLYAAAQPCRAYPASACERGETGGRLRGNHRRMPTEDAQRTKICPQCSSERNRGTRVTKDLSARHRSAQNVEKHLD